MLILITLLYHENELGTDEHYHWRYQENWLLNSYTVEMPFLLPQSVPHPPPKYPYFSNEPF